MAFSRDTAVLQRCAVSPHAPLLGHNCRTQPADTAAPPCGVQPFRGLVNYAAPLCFLYASKEPVYFALRAMFAQHWCRLNAVRSGAGGLLSLLRLFEDLLRRHHPLLVQRLRQLGVQVMLTVQQALLHDSDSNYTMT
jgi:hypothetical protein